MFQLVDLERACCPLCSSEGKFWFEMVPFSVRRCERCTAAFLSPRLKESKMRELYASSDYFNGLGVGYNDYQAQEEAQLLTFRRLLKNLQRHSLLGGELLDVGCGYGFFLSTVNAYFTACDATEYCSSAANRASSYARKVFVGGLEAISLGTKYDFISCIQVIEHIYDPGKFLKQCVQLLRPNGRLLVATPNLGGILQRILGPCWPSFKSPEHVIYFTSTALKRALQEASLTNFLQIPYPHAFPLSLIVQKVGIVLPERLGRLSVWIPDTTLAFCAVKQG